MAEAKSNLAPKTSSKNVFQRAVDWLYSSCLPESTSTKADVPSIILFLQSAGFKLREFKKKRSPANAGDEVKRNTIRITVECGSSKMIAVLEMEDVKCECSHQEATKNGSSRSTTSTGCTASRVNANAFEERKNHLLPGTSKGTATAARVHENSKLLDDYRGLNVDPPVGGTITVTNVGRGPVRVVTKYHDRQACTTATTSSALANAKCLSYLKNIEKVEKWETLEKVEAASYSMDEDEQSMLELTSSPNFKSSPTFGQTPPRVDDSSSTRNSLSPRGSCSGLDCEMDLKLPTTISTSNYARRQVLSSFPQDSSSPAVSLISTDSDLSPESNGYIRLRNQMVLRQAARGRLPEEDD